MIFELYLNIIFTSPNEELATGWYMAVSIKIGDDLSTAKYDIYKKLILLERQSWNLMIESYWLIFVLVMKKHSLLSW